MSGFRLLLGKELREQVRTMRLVAVVAVFAMAGLLSPVFARYIREIIEAVGGGMFGGMIPEPTAADAVAQFTKNIGQFGVLLAILLAMGSVAVEKERGTAALILTKPVSRTAFIAAKVVAIGALLGLALAIAGALAWLYTLLLFEPLPLGGFAAAVALLWLSLGVFAAITFFVSVLAPSALVAGGVGFAALIATGIASALPVIGPYMPPGLWAAADLLAVGRVPDPLVGPVLANLAIVAAAVAGAAAVFRRQEL